MKKELSYRKMYGKEEGRQKMKKDYDEIRIEYLEVFANHGVFPEENRQFFTPTHEGRDLRMI